MCEHAGCNHEFTALRVWHADDGTLTNLRQIQDQVLDLLSANVFALADDDVLSRPSTVM